MPPPPKGSKGPKGPKDMSEIEPLDIAYFILCIVGLMGNFFAGFIVIKKRLYIKVRFIILQNLIIEDTLFLLIKIVEKSVTFAGVTWVHDVNGTTRNITLAFLCLSMLLSASLMIDRMLAIFYCLRYHAIVTRFKARIGMAILWMFTTAYAATSLSFHFTDGYDNTNKTFQKIVMFIVIVPTWLFILISNISIEKIRRHHVKRIQSTEKQVMENQRESSVGNMQSSRETKLDFFQNTAAIVRQIKIINWITLLLMTPSCLKAIDDVIGAGFMPGDVISIFTLIYIATNSYVYILTMRELRAYASSLVCRNKADENDHSVATNISMA